MCVTSTTGPFTFSEFLGQSQKSLDPKWLISPLEIPFATSFGCAERFEHILCEGWKLGPWSVDSCRSMTTPPNSLWSNEKLQAGMWQLHCMWHEIFRLQFSESFSTTTKCGQAPLIYLFRYQIFYSQPRSMRSPPVMSSAPCRWRPLCITAYPSLTTARCGTVEARGIRKLPRNSCWYAVRKCRWSGSPLMPQNT